MVYSRPRKDRFREARLNATQLPPLPQQHNLFLKKTSKETSTYFDCRCIVFHDEPLDYIVDKPKHLWHSQQDDFVETFSLDSLVTRNAEHIGETVWVENVQLKILCANYKRHRYRNFKVYDSHGAGLKCFHVKEWFKKVATDVVFVFNDDIPLSEVYGKWNEVLQHLRFNIQIKISNREDHKLLKVDPISSPCYNSAINHTIDPELGSRWRVPNPNLRSNQLCFLNVEVISDVRIPVLKAVSFDELHRIKFLSLAQPQIMTVGPVRIEIVEHYSIEKCKVCLETCATLNHGRGNVFKREPQVQILTIEFLVHNIETPSETIRMFGYVGDLESLGIYDKMRDTFDDMKFDVYLRVQYVNNHCCSEHDEESDGNLKYQILDVWHTACKPEMVLPGGDGNPFTNWYNDVDEIIDHYQLGYVCKEGGAEAETGYEGFDTDAVETEDWIDMGVNIDDIESLMSVNLDWDAPDASENEKVSLLYTALQALER